MSSLRPLLLSLAVLLPLSAHAALNPSQPLIDAPPAAVFAHWNAPMKPFQMFSNVYYVGTQNLSALLFSTPEGLVLIDGGMDSSAEQIRDNIARMGFNIKQVKYLLNSHARLDQAGGFAKLKKWSGAKIVASKENARMLRAGGKNDFALGAKLAFPPVKADIIVKDGQAITLGGQRFVAHATPGHLPGATSWTTDVHDVGKTLTLVYADSLFTGGYYLINNKNYPNIVNDMESSFARLNAIHADIFVANKGDRFDLQAKAKRLAEGDKRAFIDPTGLQRYVAASQAAFEQQLATQRAGKP